MLAQPLCDKHRSAMTDRRTAAASENGTQTFEVYACKTMGCKRCYHESMGYFDLLSGGTETSDRQTLCESDACPMFLELVTLNEDVWACPLCKQRKRFMTGQN